MKLIYLAFVLVVISCNKKERIGSVSFKEKIISSNIHEKYFGFNIVPVTRGYDKIFVGFNKKKSYYVRNFESKNPSALNLVKYDEPVSNIWYNLFERSKEEDSILLSCHKILCDLELNNIFAVRTVDSCDLSMLLYTNIPDTSTLSKEKMVLLYQPSETIETSINCFYDINNGIVKISRGWFMFYSKEYSNYSSLH